uniref:DNA mismatch repair proteins mutS family domain-containing protein n=1 Tax=Lotharella oceanica TaxID=641309 RepID=A0A7S2TUX3_9EUKA
MMQPLRDINAIEKRLDLVELFVESQDVRSSLQEQDLKGIPDLDRILKLFKTNKATLKDLYQLWIFASKLPGIAERLKEYEGEHESLLAEEFVNPLEELIEGFEQFVALVEKLLDFDVIENQRVYHVNPDFDPMLGEYNNSLKKLKRTMERLQRECADDLGLDEKKVKMAQLPTTKRWHFRVSRKDEKLLRKRSGYTTLETRKDGAKFTTRDLTECSNDYCDLEKKYQQQQQRIVDKGMEVAATYIPVVEKASKVLARLDIFVSLAFVSVNAPEAYSRPKMLPSSSGIIELKACRHPCIETQDFVDFIANDACLERGKSNCQIITGPNMGGKSTYIRQVGVVVLMAQVGCYVPCESARISIVDCILARVGAGDSQLKGVSTFMKEMLEAAAILRTASQNSLVIVDELGRGTSTYDGFGLAWAIAEHLAKDTKAYTLFATHFHELTKLADQQPCVVNKHVTAHTDENSITMLYQVNEGACDRSFGIHVAELAKFPAKVVTDAKRKAEELEDFGSAAEGILNRNKKRRLNPAEEKEMEPAVATFLEKFRKIPMNSPQADVFAAVDKLAKEMPGNVSKKLEQFFMVIE